MRSLLCLIFSVAEDKANLHAVNGNYHCIILCFVNHGCTALFYYNGIYFFPLSCPIAKEGKIFILSDCPFKIEQRLDEEIPFAAEIIIDAFLVCTKSATGPFSFAIASSKIT